MTYERTREKSLVDFDWKEEGVEAELRELHADGFSAADICYRLTNKYGGVLSRNAVLGKINRLGMAVQNDNTVWTEDFVAELKRQLSKGRPVPSIAEKLTQTFGVTFTSSAVYHKINRLGLLKPKKKGIHTSPMDNTPILDTNTAPPIDLSSDEIPIKQRKKLLDLKEGDCRWPYGDVGKPDFFFCGANPVVKGHSYCAAHCRMAYAKPFPISEQGRLAHTVTNRKRMDPMGIRYPQGDEA